MIIFKSINRLNKEVNFKANIGFVPTMGALHKGHISLIKSSKKICKKTLVSIFINPSQFNKTNDFKKYPKNLKKDIAILKKLKVDYLLVPNVKDVYRNKKNSKIKLKKKDKIMCAMYRPGHFEGVLAVVNRFMANINSKYLFLGEKDFQQVFLIKKYLQNKYKTKIIACKTIRNKNKLPLSSRNKLLSKILLKKAENISKILFNFRKIVYKNFKNIEQLNFYRSKIEKLCDKIDYFEIRNFTNLSEKVSTKNFKIFIAYKINKVRLIDNV